MSVIRSLASVALTDILVYISVHPRSTLLYPYRHVQCARVDDVCKRSCLVFRSALRPRFLQLIGKHIVVFCFSSPLLLHVFHRWHGVKMRVAIRNCAAPAFYLLFRQRCAFTAHVCCAFAHEDTRTHTLCVDAVASTVAAHVCEHFLRQRHDHRDYYCPPPPPRNTNRRP